LGHRVANRRRRVESSWGSPYQPRTSGSETRRRRRNSTIAKGVRRGGVAGGAWQRVGWGVGRLGCGPVAGAVAWVDLCGWVCGRCGRRCWAVLGANWWMPGGGGAPAGVVPGGAAGGLGAAWGSRGSAERGSSCWAAAGSGSPQGRWKSGTFTPLGESGVARYVHRPSLTRSGLDFFLPSQSSRAGLPRRAGPFPFSAFAAPPAPFGSDRPHAGGDARVWLGPFQRRRNR